MHHPLSAAGLTPYPLRFDSSALPSRVLFPSPAERPKPMTATPEDLARLESVLRWAKTTHNRDVAATELAQALESAITYVREATGPKNVTFWVLGGVHDALSEDSLGRIYVTKVDQLRWAADQLIQLFGPLRRIDDYVAEGHGRRANDA